MVECQFADKETIMNTFLSNKSKLNLSAIIIILYFIMTANNYSQQLSISTIDNMPNMPLPYLMRDWKQVTAGYDSLVFNLNLTGEYLPLIWTDNNAINYSGQRFGLYTVVGSTPTTGTSEAINCIPAVVGAALVGIDKSNQNGYNWVSMCQEWFNKKDGLLVFQNGADGQTTDDWWYETMPNVFFYQLYSLFPNINGFNSIFNNVADQMLKSLYAMGGSTTPWLIPSMNYQGWDYAAMAPSTLHEHNEPEAAGAIAWILYSAFKVTGNSKYRVGAELSMEYLNSLTSNPSYELQLPCGVYIAAKMNAELGTNYDINKMLNWCFNNDNIRSWGVMSGSNWGGYDVDGLIGEINSSIGYGGDYPFTMNTFELIGNLVPMIRYDSRFATAIGKWALNAANACRLFYPEYLPASNQDPASKIWADQYDTNSYIAHESMHQYNPNNSSVSPYATGDAEKGGWGLTNLALYGSSHVGILGAIIDTTNVPGILRLDALKTDYFHDSAYPTYLYYNPYSSDKLVIVDLESGVYDIYDVISKSFLIHGASGVISITVPANSAVLAVITPNGGVQTYNNDMLLINGVVVDYHSVNANYPPRIKCLSASKSTAVFKDSVKIYCTAIDPANSQLSYQWTASNGNIIGSGSTVTWIAPSITGTFIISCTVKDSSGAQAKASDSISVVKSINQPPVINKLTAIPRKINIGASSIIACYASDADNDTLKYNWSALSGILTGSGPSIAWKAPNASGNYYVSCIVNDGRGGFASDSIDLEVRDFSIVDTGRLEAYYPFNGNANDASGNNNNGTVFNATLTNDRFGNANSAYSFDGSSAYIQVPVSPNLNFQNAITINYWMIVNQFFTREQYVLSQGSYTGRLKISIITDNNLRWTIHTNSSANGGIIDLDSETKLIQDSLYNVTVVYNGSDYELYLNGNLDSFSSWSGSILQTNIPMTFGQMLPTDNNYNFKGVLDDIRIYNYALSVSEIEKLAGLATLVKNALSADVPNRDILMQNYPNPFNPSTIISWQLTKNSHVILRIYDILGNEVTTLVNQFQIAGSHSISFNAEQAGTRRQLAGGIYFCELKINSGTFYKKMLYLK
jgi:hypothetical protein